MARRPSRLDLLKLDIDLRLGDLWADLCSEAFDREWPDELLGQVAAYIRAAFGKGYCDALSEDELDSLCELDIDVRLMDLWQELHLFAADASWPEKRLRTCADYMRAAYDRGRCQALAEDEPGSLCRDHGYRVPTRRIG